LLAIDSFDFTGQGSPLLLTLQKQYSPIDDENAPRLYVYDINDHGLIAKWRGSALSWSLLDIVPIKHNQETFLCALHRADSFINLYIVLDIRLSDVYTFATIN
jgi:hypothetical protein